jgi:hypothetical protein
MQRRGHPHHHTDRIFAVSTSPDGFVYAFEIDKGLERRRPGDRAVALQPVTPRMIQGMSDEELKFVATVIDDALAPMFPRS